MATQDVKVFKGLLFGTVASIIVGLIWYWIAVLTHTMYDIIVIGVGFVIAFVVSLGAGNKRGWKVQLISVLLTLLTIIYAEGLFAYNSVSSESIFSGGIIGMVATMIMLPLYAFKSLGFLGLIFSLFGLYAAFLVAKKEELKLIK